MTPERRKSAYWRKKKFPDTMFPLFEQNFFRWVGQEEIFFILLKFFLFPYHIMILGKTSKE